MTTWTAIPDASLDPGKPARSIDAKALRDNPIAIAEGATGAPKVRTAALQPPVAGATYLILNLRGNLGLGTINTGYLTADFGTDPSSPEARRGFTVLVGGVIRCSVDHWIANAVTSSYVRVLKNGVQVQEFSTNSTAPVTQTVDVTVESGDRIEFQQRTGSATYTGYWRNLKVYSNNPDFAVA